MATISLGSPAAVPHSRFPNSHDATTATAGWQVIRRNGSFSPFDATKISVAMTKAFLAVEGTGAAASVRIHDTVVALTDQVVAALTRRGGPARPIPIEDIQDQVELALMRSGEHKVARAYVLYREERARERRSAAAEARVAEPRINVRLSDERLEPLDESLPAAQVAAACEGLRDVSPEAVMTELRRNLYDGISQREVGQAMTLVAR